MTTQPRIFTAVRIVALTLLGVFLYLIWRGPERFCYESFGTLVISPEIYTRILPLPFKRWLLSALLKTPLLCYLLYAVPVFMLLGAIGAGIVSIRRNSALYAWASLVLVGIVFVVYHFLQPLGMTLNYI